jgi:hypothetical protein
MMAMLRAIQKAARFGAHRVLARHCTSKRCRPIVRLVTTPSAAICADPLCPASSPVRHRAPVSARHTQHTLDVPTITGGKSEKWHGTGQKPSDGSADTADIRHARAAVGNTPRLSGDDLRNYANASAAC